MIFDIPESLVDRVAEDLSVIAAMGAQPESPEPERYGADLANAIFRMHPYCWCEHPDCPWCTSSSINAAHEGAIPETVAPNFWHRESGIRIWWYKTLGRSMHSNQEFSEAEWLAIVQRCKESLLGLA